MQSPALPFSSGIWRDSVPFRISMSAFAVCPEAVLVLVYWLCCVPGAAQTTYNRMCLQEDIAAAGQVVETTRDPMFRDPKTHEYLG